MNASWWIVMCLVLMQEAPAVKGVGEGVAEAVPVPVPVLVPSTTPLPDTEADYYTLHTVPIPEGVVLEVGGLLPWKDGSLLVCTRRGDVFHLSAPWGEAPVFTLFADGLQEPLGLLADGEAVLTVQRGEITRLIDTDGDLRADVYETVNDDWELSGSYHEYAFGPVRDADGNLWITLNIPFGGQPFGKVDWRGWAMRLTPSGALQPVVAGLRSPAGVEVSPWGDIFYTDNQGEWNGASKLAQLIPGEFHGHPLGIDSAHRPESWVDHPGEIPDGVLMPTAMKRVPGFTLPAVWFPYDVTGRSPSGMAWDTTGGAFGPFDGQLFVGDQYGANILRVFLEQVGDVWQGACFRFREGLQSGVIRVAFDESGGLWAGMSDRGWSSLGPDPWGLQGLQWTGKTPFEIRALEALENGFRMTFTEPVDELSVVQPHAWALRRFTYRLHSDYGSPEVDDWPLEVEDYSLSQDGLVLELTVPGLREGYVHEIIATGLRDTDGRSLLHPEAWYTLRKRPGASRPPRVVFIAAEALDRSDQSLPMLAELLERHHGLDCRIATLVDQAANDDSPHADEIDGLDELRDADLAVLALGSLQLSSDQLDVLMRYVDSGRPLVALRSTLNAFAFDEDSESAERVDDFARDVLGSVDVVARDAASRVEPVVLPADPDEDIPTDHPVLHGMAPFDASSHSGAETPGEGTELTADCVVLLEQPAADETEGRPVLWVRNRSGARIVVTTLGHPKDWQADPARRAILNSILWALDLDVPPGGALPAD